MAAGGNSDLLSDFDINRLTPAQIDMVATECGVDLMELASPSGGGEVKLGMREKMALLWLLVRTTGVDPDLEWDALWNGPVGQVEELTKKLTGRPRPPAPAGRRK